MKKDGSSIYGSEQKNYHGNAYPIKRSSEIIKDALQDPNKQERLKSKIPALHLFGLSIITDYHLDLLYEIAKTSEVYFHLVNPAPMVYWFEDRSEKQLAFLIKKGFFDKSENNPGNTLLTSWGRVIQDTFMMLFKNEELLNNFREINLKEPPQDSLLHKIQNDIYNGATKEERNAISIEDVSDGSINISSCYTIAREVEVLYNYLVHLVDQKKEKLSPRDIVVMVTDIDAYAPYIKAVFKNAPYKFYFTIADETFVNSDTLLSALSAILKMNRYNFKAEEVLQLLDSKYIRKRFGITDLEFVRKLVNAANIRFGMEGKHEDDTRFVSWEYGIKRIMYGVCISGNEEYIDPYNESLFPLDIAEGSGSLEMIRFCHFVMVLMDSINEREKTRKIKDWVDYTDRVIQNMICEPEEEMEEDYLHLQKQLSNFNNADEFLDEKISFDIFSHSLLSSLSAASHASSFAGGGITFCSLIPMRSIPFKVVALLGLNFDKFPRKESASGFNLIESDKRRRGDRNVKENDKHLFLDTLLSAEEYLYISYLGQSAKDNTTIPPSALVDELIDYIEAGCDEPEKVRSILTFKHPLHSFSRKYQQALPGYHHYLDRNKRSEIKTINNNKVIAPTNFEEISTGALISFLKHPVKGYYNKVLGIYYGEDAVLLSDTEIFDLNGLQKWSLKPKLVATEPGNTNNLRDRLVKTGGLPLKNMAGIAIEKVENEISTVRDLFRNSIGKEREDKVQIEIKIGNSVLKGSQDNIYGSKLVFVSYSKKEIKYLLDAYIRYLLSLSAGNNLELYFISANKEAIFKGNPISPSEAIRRLTELVKIYKEGHEEIIPFFPDIAVKPTEVAVLDEEILRKAVNNFFHSYTASSDDQYLLNEYANGIFTSAGIVENYKIIAEKLLKPLAEIFPAYFQ